MNNCFPCLDGTLALENLLLKFTWEQDYHGFILTEPRI
jgi:hypothetical protein